MRNAITSFFIVLFSFELIASGVLMNKKVTKEDLENLSLKFGGDSKNVKQQQLRKQYPWLVSRDELHKELQKIEEKNVSESDKEAEVSIDL